MDPEELAAQRRSRARRFSQPDGRDMYVSQPLTNISVAYMQSADEFVADKIFPNIPVMRQAGSYWTYDRDNWNRPEAKVRAPGSESVGGGWNTRLAQFFAEVYAFHKDVTKQDEANAAAPFNLDREATDFVTRQLLLTREVIFAQKYFASDIWGTDLTGVSGAAGTGTFKQWNDSAATPIRDIRSAATLMQQRTGFRPNKLVLGPLVYDELIDHPTVLERIKYTDSSVPDEALLARLFRVDQVMIASAIQNTAPEASAATNEQQTITITGTPTGGSFTVTFRGVTSGAIAYNATAAAVQTALRAMASIGPKGVSVTGGPFPGTAAVVTFTGPLAASDQPLMTTADSLTGGSSPATAVTVTTHGLGEANSFIFGKAALLAYAPASPGLLTPSAGYTFTWNEYLPGQGLGVAIDRIPMPAIKSTRIEGEQAFDMKAVATDLGTYFSGAVA